jgi:hypothetical protein
MVATRPLAPYPLRALSEGRHASRSSRRKPLAIAIAAAVVVLAVGLVYALTTGKSPIPGINLSPKQSTPPFQFTVSKKSGALPTAPQGGTKPTGKNPLIKLKGNSKNASNSAISAVTSLYTEAFLDPNNWQNGSYDNVWAAFVPGAAKQAQGKDMAILTAGASAGDTYSTILPVGSTVRTKVLLDPNGGPISVDAIVAFHAVGSAKTGPKDTRFVSQGQFIFQKVGSAWKIVSYQVKRSDQKIPKPTPTASGSGAPSAGSS